MEVSSICETRSIELENNCNLVKVAAVAIQGLEDSVCFGRFAAGSSDAWMRRSSFSHNQCMEELGNFSRTGSVAQKRAFFEDYYKVLAEKASEKELLKGSSMLESSVLGKNTDKESHYGNFLSVDKYQESVSPRTKKDLDIDILKEGEKLGKNTNIIGLEIRQDQVDPHYMEDKYLRSSNASTLTNREEIRLITLYEEEEYTALPLDYNLNSSSEQGSGGGSMKYFSTPTGQNSEIFSNIVAVMKEKEPQMSKKDNDEIAVPLSSFDKSEKPGETLPIASENVEYETKLIPSLAQVGNFGGSREESSLHNLDNGKHEHYKEFQASEVLITHTTHNHSTFPESLDGKNMDTNNSDIMEKFKVPQKKNFANHQYMNTNKAKQSDVSQLAKFGQLSQNNMGLKKSVQDKIKKNKGMGRDINERSVSAPRSRSSHSKFTVPQPFSLETDKRASIALTLSQSFMERPMANCPSLQQMKKSQALLKLGQRSFDAMQLQRELLKKSDGYTELTTPQKKQGQDGQRTLSALQELPSKNEYNAKGREIRSPTKVRAFCLQTDVRAEKRKEFNAKLQAKMIAIETNKFQPQSKSKVNAKVEAKVKNTKAKENSNLSITKEEAKSEARNIKNPVSEKASPKRDSKMEETESEARNIKNPVSEKASPKRASKEEEAVSEAINIKNPVSEKASPNRASKMMQEEDESEARNSEIPVSEKVLPKRASKMIPHPCSNLPKLRRKSREPSGYIIDTQFPKVKDEYSLSRSLPSNDFSKSTQLENLYGKFMGLGEKSASSNPRLVEGNTKHGKMNSLPNDFSKSTQSENSYGKFTGFSVKSERNNPRIFQVNTKHEKMNVVSNGFSKSIQSGNAYGKFMVFDEKSTSNNPRLMEGNTKNEKMNDLTRKKEGRDIHHEKEELRKTASREAMKKNECGVRVHTRSQKGVEDAKDSLQAFSSSIKMKFPLFSPNSKGSKGVRKERVKPFPPSFSFSKSVMDMPSFTMPALRRNHAFIPFSSSHTHLVVSS